jgi:reactive intermediate/imine deaminase
MTMNHSPLATPSVHPPTGYSHATRVGNLLFIAGQIAKDQQGNLVGKGDITAQAEQVFANLQAILADAGCTMADIVKLTTFTVDSRYRSAIAEVRARYCKEYLPPNSFVVVAGLAEPEFLLEIEAIAALPAES